MQRKYIDRIILSEPDAEYTLPMPPSVNQAYANSANGMKRIKSVCYKKWIAEAKFFIYDKKIVSFSGPVAVVHDLFLPKDKRRRDCANFEKVTSDFLVSMGILEDDSLIKLNVQQWVESQGDDRGVRVMIFSLD